MTVYAVPRAAVSWPRAGLYPWHFRVYAVHQNTPSLSLSTRDHWHDGSLSQLELELQVELLPTYWQGGMRLPVTYTGRPGPRARVLVRPA